MGGPLTSAVLSAPHMLTHGQNHVGLYCWVSHIPRVYRNKYSYFAHKVFGVCGCSGRPPGYLGKAKESLDFWHTLAAFVKNKQQIFWWVTDAFFMELSWRTTFLTRDDKTLTRSRCLQCTELQQLAELKREGQRRQRRQRPTAKSTAVHSPARIAVSILCLRVFPLQTL